MNNKGETLIELIVSLALLALLVTMLATAFQASTGSLATNIETKRNLNEQVRQLTLEESLQSAGNLTISYQYEAGSVIYSDSFGVELLQPQTGSLYKFRGQSTGGNVNE